MGTSHDNDFPGSYFAEALVRGDNLRRALPCLIQSFDVQDVNKKLETMFTKNDERLVWKDKPHPYISLQRSAARNAPSCNSPVN